MVEKRWLAVFIVICELGLDVGLDLIVHSVIPCLCTLYQQNHRQKALIERLYVCAGDWHCKI